MLMHRSTIVMSTCAFIPIIYCRAATARNDVKRYLIPVRYSQFIGNILFTTCSDMLGLIVPGRLKSLYATHLFIYYKTVH